ncbi:MAG: phosphocholine cytidylyltransferase family protein [Rhodocyclaceae bacterium]
MHAILLAAGRGSRMGQSTRDKPKCLTPLLDQPLLAWQLATLRTAGVADIHVVRGYRKELLPAEGFNTFDNDDWADTNMVATLRCAAPILQQHTSIVSYSDIVYHPDHIRALTAAQGDIVITYDRQWEALWRLRFNDPLADAETFRQQDGRLLSIGERAGSIADIEGQYMGLLRFSPAGWAQVEAFLDTLTAERRARIDMTSTLRGLLDRGVGICCLPVDGRWCEVDSEEDARRYEAQLDRPERWSHDWR